jgi:hypothetical protein
MRITITRWMRTVVVASVFSLAVGSAFADGELDTLITVHQVDMKGSGLDEMARKAFESTASLCNQGQTKVEPIPKGDKYDEITEQRYYAPGIMTTYQTAKTYMIYPDCSVKRQVTEKIETQTANGFCKFNPKTKVATGFCAVTVAGLSVKAPLRGKVHGAPTGGHETIAGHPCKSMKALGFPAEKLSGELCVADTGAFADAAMAGYRQPGITLRMVLRSTTGVEPMLELEATKVTNNIKVPASLLAPQLTDTYEVRDSRGWKRGVK